MRRTKSSRDRDRDRDLWCETFLNVYLSLQTPTTYSATGSKHSVDPVRKTRNVNKTRLAFAEHFTKQILGIPGLIKCILM